MYNQLIKGLQLQDKKKVEEDSEDGRLPRNLHPIKRIPNTTLPLINKEVLLDGSGNSHKHLAQHLENTPEPSTPPQGRITNLNQSQT